MVSPRDALETRFAVDRRRPARVHSRWVRHRGESPASAAPAGNTISLVLNFGLETETQGSSVLVTIRGDLDIQVTEHVADELSRVESANPTVLVLDLRRLSFMDSSGMAVVAAAHARATDAGRRFAVVAPPAGVMHAFKISGLADLITIAAEVSEAYP
jgi:anti-sigma B factor antagonist